MEYTNIQYDFPEISKDEKFVLFDKLKSEETKSMNFDQYRKKVYNELSTIETDIISNLAKHDKEFMEMFKNFEESDEILNKLETKLLFFKNKLSDINNDMKMLQNKSSEITIKLKNRKEFEEELFKLLDSIILAPEFLNDIICKDIDDEFINKINKLEEKLQTFTGGELPESSAINEIIPELRKTLAKVCSKIYSHILNTFLMLNKPGTNIQIIQKNVFLKMKQLVVFLKKHAPSMYTELLNKYVSLMEKIYLNSTTKYCQELIKLIYTKPEKFSLTLTEELSKEFFNLVEKRKQDTVKNIEKESIIPLYALTKKETYFNEQIFQSLNKFLMDLITWEVLFFNDFFDMGIQQSAVYLNNIYKTSVNLIFEFVQKNLINKNADYFSISLMIIVDYEQQKIMEDLKLNHLDYYFFELLKLLWVKFDQIFKSINEQIFKSNNKNPKLLNNGIHSVTHKVGELLSMINLISKNTTNTPMILVKIKEIQLQFNQFFSTLAENMKYNNNNDREELITIFFINNLYYLLVKLSDFEAIKDETDKESFDKVLNNKREMYLNLLINKYFEDMNKLLQKCISKNDKASNNINNQNEINFIKEEVSQLNKNDLKNIAQYFNSKYRDILNSVKKSIYNNITDNENAKNTYTKFLNELLNKYAAFIDLLRYSKNEDLLMNIVSVQKLMIEINNIMKGI
jgi:CII-binding regulator of phage lambda lysogenization HflD